MREEWVKNRDCRIQRGGGTETAMFECWFIGWWRRVYWRRREDIRVQYACQWSRSRWRRRENVRVRDAYRWLRSWWRRSDGTGTAKLPRGSKWASTGQPARCKGPCTPGQSWNFLRSHFLRSRRTLFDYMNILTLFVRAKIIFFAELASLWFLSFFAYSIHSDTCCTWCMYTVGRDVCLCVYS